MQLISGVNCIALTTICLFQEMLNRLKIVWSKFFFKLSAFGNIEEKVRNID